MFQLQKPCLLLYDTLSVSLQLIQELYNSKLKKNVHLWPERCIIPLKILESKTISKGPRGFLRKTNDFRKKGRRFLGSDMLLAKAKNDLNLNKECSNSWYSHER